MMGGARQTLIATLAENRDVAELSPSPFYAHLLDRMREDVEAGGPTWDLLQPFATDAATEYYPFRALAGVHLEVLDGQRPALAAHYPSVGGDGDAEAAWPLVRETFIDKDPDVIADIGHPLQTNETSRCGALIGGMCEVARSTGMPLRILELGASAGLNLHMDRYRYEGGDAALGPADSPVRFIDYWEGGVPDLGAPVEIAERAGCDLNPLDVTAREGQIELESYVWPDEHARLAELRSAIGVAAAMPVKVDRESADTWVASRLETPAEGLATVVFHSIFWVYVPEEVRRGILDAIQAAAARATAAAPLAWLRYEESTEDPRTIEIRLTTWPGGSERLLGTGLHHRSPVQWVG